MELTALYSDKIIEIAGQVPSLDRLEHPDAAARKTSRICGSVVSVEVALQNSLVSAYFHEISACALGQTSAAIVAAHIVGSSCAELRLLHNQVAAMLKTGGVPPIGKWSDFKYLEPVRTYPARHASTLLVLDAVVDCLDQIERRDPV